MRAPGGRTSSGSGLACAGEVFITHAADEPPNRAESAALRPTSSLSFVSRASVNFHSRAPSGHSALQLKQVTHSEGDQFSFVWGFAPPAQTSRHCMQWLHLLFMVSRSSPTRERIPSSPPSGQTNRQKKRVRYRFRARMRKKRAKKNSACSYRAGKNERKCSRRNV